MKGQDTEAIVASILERLLEGSLDPMDAIERLSPYASIELDENPSYVTWKRPVSAEVRIYADDIRRGLSQYLAFAWDEDRLRRWASLLVFFDHYHAPEPPTHDEDINDDMWDVLHELGLPAVFGEITHASVHEKLKRLQKYDH